LSGSSTLEGAAESNRLAGTKEKKKGVGETREAGGRFKTSIDYCGETHRARQYGGKTIRIKRILWRTGNRQPKTADRRKLAPGQHLSMNSAGERETGKWKKRIEEKTTKEKKRKKKIGSGQDGHQNRQLKEMAG